jgi:transposase
MTETVVGAVVHQAVKRQRRSPEEKRRIVEATLIPGASISRVAREHGVNANQVFQWRHEYRKQTCWAVEQRQAELLPVRLTAELSGARKSAVVLPGPPAGSIHIELPGRVLISVDGGVDVALVRAVIESLRQ